MTRRSNGRGWIGRKLSGVSIVRLLAEADIVAVCLRGLDGAVLGQNHAYLRLTGAVGTAGAGAHEHAVKGCLPDGKWRRASYFNAAGRRVHVLMASAALPGNEGLQVTLAVDVTRREEEQLRVRDSRSLADELYRTGYATTIEHLSSWLIHEMSQPLMATVATAQGSRRLLARRRTDLRELGNSIEDIVNYQRRAGRALQRLRGVLPRSEPRRARLDVNELILEVVRFLRDRGDLRGMSVRLHLSRRSLLVNGVRGQLRQVFLNVLLSALEAMCTTPLRRRRISIRASPGNRQTALHIIVRDSGDMVRKPGCMQFFATLSGAQPGAAALGLPVAGAIVTDHGGRMWLKRLRRGAEIHVTLPVALPREE